MRYVILNLVFLGAFLSNNASAGCGRIDRITCGGDCGPGATCTTTLRAGGAQCNCKPDGSGGGGGGGGNTGGPKKLPKPILDRVQAEEKATFLGP